MVREYRNHFLYEHLRRAALYRVGSMCQALKDIELSAYNNVNPPKYSDQPVGRRVKVAAVLDIILGTGDDMTHVGGVQIRKVNESM